MSFALQIYHQMPPWARSFTASLRGFYLNSWRYDSQTEKLVEEILERDYWSDGQWEKWKSERLSFILKRAAAQVPFYREQWRQRRLDGDKASPEYLENWRILEKHNLKTQAAEFVADDCSRRKMYLDHTSGTTGTSLNIWSSAATVKLWYATFEARSRRWYGISRNDRWAMLGGQLVTPIKQRKPPFWIWNAGLNQLYMSSYHLSPELIPAYLAALKKYRVRYILGYPSAIYAVASEIVRQKRDDLKMDVVIANAEPLFDYQREVIAEAFGCPVRETYGMAEIAAAGGECELGNLHQWQDVGIIEADDRSAAGETTDFICTGLINQDMPLIRYRIGDCGRFSEKSCACGRTHPIIEKIEGRIDDVLYTKDGRRVGRLDPVFKSDLFIQEAQIIQNSLEELTVKYVPAEGFGKKSADILTENIRERMGDVRVKMEQVEKIPRTARGKFRSVICSLSEREKQSVQNRNGNI